MDKKKRFVLVFALLFFFLFVIGGYLILFSSTQYTVLYFLVVGALIVIFGMFLFVQLLTNLDTINWRIKNIELGKVGNVPLEVLTGNKVKVQKEVYKIPRFPKKLSGSFWGITTFYNPADYKNKYVNYKLFREKSKEQGLKLIAVELAFEDKPFELKKTDAEIVVQIRGNESNILWQKEALLNIGLKHLPKGCDKVAWLDCDIIFKNNNWIKETSKLLEEYIVVQPFAWALKLGEGVHEVKNLDKIALGQGIMQKSYGIGYGVSKFGKTIRDGESLIAHGHTGFSWAFRKELLDKCGFYDKAILGGGDLAMAFAYYDFNGINLDEVFPNKSFRNNYDPWRKKICKKNHKSVYFTPGYIFHLWHGDVKDRQYFKRSQILKENDYDPVLDVKKDSLGLLFWASNKPELHSAVKRYFLARKEEGSFL